MSIELITKAEKNAKKAESLDAFKSINLAFIKSRVAQILGLIGKNGIFGEYTKHDISHINKVLKSLDWLIPEVTANNMTSGDWLMVVLSIYFHDLGMLVTEDEFKNRNKSDFAKYKKNILEDISNSTFINKINSLGKEEAERFLYQEFVRSKHAERVKNWITAKSNDHLGYCESIVKEIIDLLAPLDDKFKKDLAMICESHHLYDLDDFQKYKVVYRYGSDEQEAINLHYCALILRTADLLHITSDRTPSTEFRLINPSDPKSQEEWYKQMAVSAVSPKPKTDKDEKVDHKIQSDTVEVTAYFKGANKANGFFGLTSYLNFARKELLRNYKWAQEAQLKHGSKLIFPWKDIDDSNIETEGFEKKLFVFKLDQSRILRLLVGHTLYNDSTVVLRELIQNSIDAVRLQNLIDKKNNPNSPIGEVRIDWNSKKRIITFSDNGTGMTMDIIEDHLLNVGSSRYQSDLFKKNYPDFAPISRFGIGILTCFLISDDIDIITNHQEESTVKKLSIRKVDGKYLLQHLNKSEAPNFIREHGTIIRLEVRSDVQMNNLTSDISKWILFPPCDVTLRLDSNTQYKIGYESPKEAIESYLIDLGYEVDNKNIKVEEHTQNGVKMAYALKFSKFFNEWSFFDLSEPDDADVFSPIGTCVEGIRVEFNTPGYKNSRVVSVANATGKNAPTTNVARSNIEVNTEKETLLKDIYKLYINHITNEIKSVQEKGGFSLTWAITESSILLEPLISSKGDYSSESPEAIDESLLLSTLGDAHIFLIEERLQRRSTSLNELNLIDDLWVTDCNLFKSADSLIREIPGSSSLTGLMKTLYANKENMSHLTSLFCGFDQTDVLHKAVLNNRQIAEIKVYPFERRVDIRWSLLKSVPHWLYYKVTDTKGSYNPFDSEQMEYYIQLEDCKIEGLADENIIKCFDNCYIFIKGSPFHAFITSVINASNDSKERQEVVKSALVILNDYLINFTTTIGSEKGVEQIMKRRLETDEEIVSDNIFKKYINKNNFINAILSTHWKVFNSSAWSRRTNNYYDL